MNHLIFDFDGVIGDTWEAAIQAHLIRKTRPDRESAIEEMTEYFSNKPHHTKDHELSDTELADEYEWTSKFGEAVQAVGFSLFEDFVSEIEKLPTRHKAVVSSGSQNYVMPALAKTNLKLSHILAFENHHSKEEKIETICKDWGVEISEVYYFTDTLADVYELKDFISKEKLIGVSWGFCSKEQLLSELDEKQILDSAGELSELLKK